MKQKIFKSIADLRFAIFILLMIAIISVIGTIIEQNQSIVIWPDNIEEKDINDMILSGKTSVEIHRIISKNTFSNLHAKTRLINWKKI